MRPKKLTMKAFGSYVTETTVDFDEIGNRLYLITGDTGAGKTTIFDALSYALFGAASGQYRKAANFHSDYVGYDIPTEVTLEYEHGGHEHKVFRKISFSTVRGKKDENGAPVYNPAPKQDAVFYEFGKAPVERSSDVTEAVEKQLGMDVSQFRKIVMLAQGEFRKFLDADDKERAEILDRLFDFGRYQDFQNRIKNALNMLERETEEYRSERSTLVKSFRMPEGLSEEEQALYSADHPELIKNLETLLAADEQKLSEAEEEKTGAEQAAVRAADRLRDGRFFNGKLAELEKAKEHQSELNARRAEMSELKKEGSDAEKALREVQPKENTYRDKAGDLKKLLADKKEAETKESDSRKKLEEAEQKKTAAHEENDGPVSELTKQAEQIRDSLPGYMEQEADIRKRDEKQGELDSVAGSIKENGEKQKENAEKLKLSGNELEALGNVDAGLEAAKTEWQKARDIKAGFEKICVRVQALLKAGAAETEKTEELKKQVEKLEASKTVYDKLYNAFLYGQVRMLAAELKTTIETQGSAVCKVCGTVHKTVPASVLSGKDEAPVTEEAVKKAETDWRSAQTAYDAAREDIHTLHAENEAERRSLLGETEKLPGAAADWETLSSEEFLSGKKETFEAAEKEAGENYAALRDNVKKRDELKASVKEQEAEKERLQKEYEAYTVNKTDLEKEIAGIDSTITLRKKSLQYASLEEAKAKAEEMQREVDEKAAALSKADADAENAQKQRAAAEGALRALNGQVPDAEKAEADAKAEYERAVTAAGFADEAFYRKALPAEGEKRVDEINAELLKYNNDCRDTERAVKDLTAECGGKTVADLDALEEECRQKDILKKEAESNYTKCYSIKESHEKTLEEIKKAAEKSAVAEAACGKLKILDSVASGGSASGGKLTFQRYVMGETFREMLDAANVRLDSMTGGRYQFMHKIESDRDNSAAGLGIELMDYQTGKARSCAGISGGESFQMSMALALGLSDVVSRHTGGRTIDSMFIDEGFGALSEKALDDIIRSLEELSGNARQIGIISHVARLEECISPKIVVKCTDKGSSLKII